MKKMFYFLVFPIIFSGCVKEFEYRDSGDIKPYPTVISFFGDGDTVKINLILSEPFYTSPIDNNFESRIIKNAKFFLYENNKLIDTEFLFNDSIYISNTVARKKNTYKLKVYVPGYDTLYAFGSVPDKNILKNIYYRKIEKYDNRDYYRVSFTIFDSSAIDTDYYQIYIDSYGMLCESNNLLLAKDNFSINNNDFIVFPDYDFNGDSVNLFFDVQIPSYTDTVELSLFFRHITKDYYFYQKTLSLQFYANDRSGFLTEPVRLYSNIKNGYGIFAGYNENANFLILKNKIK